MFHIFRCYLKKAIHFDHNCVTINDFRRRYEREKIGAGGAPECWGNSPEHALHSE